MEKVRIVLAGFGLTLAFVFVTGFLASLIQTVGGFRLFSGILRGTAHAAEQPEKADKTLSPYFFVKSDDPTLDQLPLKSTSVSVDIAGVIADIKVVQTYKNEGQRPIEAIYIFPASTKAAVYGMKMTIGERTIVAQVQKREEARRNYEQAKQEGKSASLLEQQRPNVFQMNVANILPGDEIKTELQYTELLTPDEGIYEFVYPTVVGPRYSNQPAENAPESEKWVENPYLHQGESPSYSFDIVTHLAAGVPVQHMACPSHKVDVQYEDPSRATVKLDATEKSGGNKDFILRYRLAGDKITSGLLLYKGKDENFFLLMMQPPKRVDSSEIPGREFIFVVDVSGSMNGFPLNISKELLKNLIGKLKNTDVFNVLLFSGGSKLMSEHSLPATAENVQRAIDVIDREHGSGGTELLPALQRVLALPAHERFSRSIVVVTDGYVNIETEAFDLIRSKIGQANVFAFGIGSSVNRFLIDGMARAGAGEPFVITKPAEAHKTAEKFRRYVQSPLLTQIKLDFGGFEAYDVEPAGVPDVFAERPVVVFGKWRGQPKGKIVLRGITGGRDYEQSVDVAGIEPQEANAALRYLWSRSRIAQLGDYNQLQRSDKRIAAITDLALKYNLLSAYTSFVAIDTQVRLKEGQATTVKQPLPLPEGVSDYAVGPGSPMPTGFLKQSGRYLSAAPVPPSSYPRSAAEKKEAETSKGGRDRSSEDAGSHGVDKALKIGKIKVSGELSEAAVRKILEDNLADLQKCLPKTMAAFSGEVAVEWIVGRDGKVRNVKIVSSPASVTPPMEKCLTEWVKLRNFAPLAGKGETTITVSFLFGSGQS